MNLDPTNKPPTPPTMLGDGLALEQHVLALCGEARARELSGDYEEAQALLAEYWKEVGAPVLTSGLSQRAAAEISLRTGTLTGYLGSARQIAFAQEIAKEILTTALRHFQSLKDAAKLAETQNALGVCYWREGAYDEAAIWVRSAISAIHDDTHPISLLAYINLAMTLTSQGDIEGALDICDEIEQSVQLCGDHGVSGRYFNILSLLYGRKQDFDRALEYCLHASHHFERAGHRRFYGRVETNIGEFYVRLGKLGEAQYHLTQAASIYESLKDESAHAEALETLARVHLARRHYAEAEQTARAAVSYFEKGDEYGRLVESLRTHAKVLSRTGHVSEAFTTYARAYAIASERLGEASAVELLSEIESTLYFKEGLPLKEERELFEAHLIKRALQASNGSITHAAHKLGVLHQSLIDMLNGRHRALKSERTTAQPRPFQRTGRKKRTSKKRPAPKAKRTDSPELLAIKANTNRLSDLGIREGCFVFFLPIEVQKNDPVVVARKENPHEFHLGYISWEFGLICLAAGNADYEPLPLSENEVVILGKIIGYRPDQLDDDSQFYLIRSPHDEQ